MNIHSADRFGSDPEHRLEDLTAGPSSELVMVDRSSLLCIIELAHTLTLSLERKLEPCSVKRPSTGSSTVAHLPFASRLAKGSRAREIYRFRRRRDALLGSDLFGEPVWDLILDLFSAQAEGRKTCISSACIAAAVPSTTALRWIKELEARGLVTREDDAADARRSFLALSPAFFEQIADILSD